jgi:5'-3' exoribonuclease 1
MCAKVPESEIFYNVFLYVDRMVHLVKPKKVLMISADGVAPRAKMNQQRTRRFRKTKMNQSDIDSMSRMGLDHNDMFNSDKISAGTEFMQNLSIAFKGFIEDRIKNDILWEDLKVIFTGSEVPGEGEHKVKN